MTDLLSRKLEGNSFQIGCFGFNNPVTSFLDLITRTGFKKNILTKNNIRLGRQT